MSMQKITEIPQPFAPDKPVKKLPALANMELQDQVNKVKQEVENVAKELTKDKKIEIGIEDPPAEAFKQAGLKRTLGNGFMLVDVIEYKEPTSQTGALVSMFVTKAKTHPDLLVPILVAHQRDDNLGREIAHKVYQNYEKKYGLTPDQMAKTAIVRRFNKICHTLAKHKKKVIAAIVITPLAVVAGPPAFQEIMDHRERRAAQRLIEENNAREVALKHFQSIRELKEKPGMSSQDFISMIELDQLEVLVETLSTGSSTQKTLAAELLDDLASNIFEKFSKNDVDFVKEDLIKAVQNESDQEIRHQFADTLFSVSRAWDKAY